MPNRSTARPLVAFLAVLSAAATARSATVNLTPVADAFVSSANPTNNYGGAGALQVSAPGLPKGEFQSVLRFDLTSAKSNFDAAFGAGNWQLTSAAFQFTAGVPGNPILNTSAAGQIAASWMQNDSWVEGAGTPMSPGATGITFNSLPSFLSASDESLGQFAFSGATSGAANYALTASAGLLADLAAGSTASILLKAASGDTAVSGLFNSRSFMTVESRDLLVLTAVPEPNAIVIVAACLVALLSRPRTCQRSVCV